MTRARSRSVGGAPVDRSSYRVLLIEDDPAHRYIYRRFLEQQDKVSYEVHEAPNADAGLDACERIRPDCIVVDFRLPDLNGLDLLPALRARTAAPIIFVTAHPEPLTMTKAYREGALKYLSKDFLSSETFQAAVAEALRL
mgnify:CR=1 FL=1|jgi:CheY-like chemotaxis protein